VHQRRLHRDVLERRDREVAVHLVLRVEQRLQRLRMAELHLVAVEPAVLARAERLFERDPIIIACIETRMVGTAMRSFGRNP
jgi:hypothetical protein